MSDIKKLKVKLFADGADLGGIEEMAANPLIAGFTTNPTLMRKAGGASETFALNAKQMASGNVEPAFIVQPGDVITVAESRF